VKVSCPNCSHEWDEKLHATICNNKVACTQSVKISNIFNHINRQTKRGIFAKKVFGTIKK